MPRRSNIRAPPAVGKKNNNFAAQNRRERGRKQKYLGRKDKRAGGIKTKNEDKNIDSTSVLFKTVFAHLPNQSELCLKSQRIHFAHRLQTGERE